MEDESDNETSGSEAIADDEYTLVSYLNQPFIHHSFLSSTYQNDFDEIN